MFCIKRKLLLIILLFFAFQDCFSQISIGGLSVQNAEKSGIEKIETKYGTYTTKAGYPVLRYESGAIKSFYIEDNGHPVTFAKFYHPEYKVEMIIATPVPKEDYLSQRNAQPLEFWENGNIKTLKLADVKYSYNTNGYLNIKFEKYKETLAIFPKSTIHFYENGNIESIKVANGQSFQFLRDLKVNSKNKPVFKNQSEIKFYDDGFIKEFTPQYANIKNALNFSIRPGSSVVVSKENPSVAIAFYPASGATIALSDTVKVTCVQGEPLIFYEDGVTLKQISWTFDTNFKLGNVSFYCGLGGESTSQTVKFSKTGVVSSVSGILTTDLYDTSKKIMKTYPTLVEGQAVEVCQIDYDELGNKTMINFGRNPFTISSRKIKKGFETIKLWKLYYKNGEKVAGIGNVLLESSEGNFYDTNYSCVVLFENETVKTIATAKEVNVSASSNLFFDDLGNPKTYSGTDANGNIIEKTLQ